jgi:hypothetical protein
MKSRMERPVSMATTPNTKGTIREQAFCCNRNYTAGERSPVHRAKE